MSRPSFPTPCGLVSKGVLQRHSSSLCNIERRRSYQSCGLPPFPPRLGFKQFGLHHTRPSFLTSGPWYSGFISLAHIMLLSPHAFRMKVSLCSLKAQVRCCFNHITPVMPLPGQRLLCHMGAILWALRFHRGLPLEEIPCSVTMRRFERPVGASPTTFMRPH